MGSDNPQTKSSKARRALKLRWERGQILLLTALLMPILMGFTGLAIDVGMLTARRTNQQAAADSAVIAGAQKWFHDGTEFRTAEAEAFATQNGYTNGVKDTTVTVSYPDSCGILTTYGAGYCMKVTITRTSDTFFMRVLGLNDATITTSATAVVDDSPRPYALIVLDETACRAYDHSGTGDLVLDGGGAIVNSDGSESGCDGVTAEQHNTGSLVTADNCMTSDDPPEEIDCTLDHLSGTTWEYQPGTASPAPTTVGKPVDDPLKDLDRPVPCTTDAENNDPLNGCIPQSLTSEGSYDCPGSSCFKLTQVTGGQCPGLVDGSNCVLQPGTYYGGLSIVATNVVFLPGLYIFAGGGGNTSSQGGFQWNTSGTGRCLTAAPSAGGVSCATAGVGVTFYNMRASWTATPAISDGNKNCGNFEFGASSSGLNLTAPPDTGDKGPFNDEPVNRADLLNGVETMVFWQSDDCVSDDCGDAEAFKYAGSGNTLGGIVYLPEACLNMSGGGTFGAVQVIVDKVDFTGNADTTITYENYIDISRPFWALVE